MPIKRASKGTRRNTTIEWCTHTRNFAGGCSEARRADGTMVPACVHCYARFQAFRVRRMQSSQGRTSVHDGVSRATGGHSAVWTGTFRWDRALMARHFASMRPGDVTFINSLSDLWHPEHDPAMLVALATEIRALETRWRGHELGVPRVVTLTKRGAGLLAWQRERFPDGLPAHVLAGVTGGEQPDVDDQLQHLLQVNMRGPRVISIEPMTGPVDLTCVKFPLRSLPAHRVDALRGGYWNMKGWVACGPAAELGAPRGGFTNHSGLGTLGWVIVGAESGHGARALDTQWVRNLRDQVTEAGVPFFYKQGPGADGPVTSKPELDGKAWTEIPALRALRAA